MKRHFVDYDGPTGAYIATERGSLPLSDPQGMAAAIESAMLVSLGSGERARAYQRPIERRRVRRPPAALPGARRGLGLPSTPARQGRELRAAISRHAETLRRLAR